MKKILLATVAALVAAPALAADLPRRASAPAPVYAAPVFTWSGFYVGAQVGYGWTKDKFTVVTPAATPFELAPKGVRGGLHVGYNWQTGAFVYGLEGDLEFANARDSETRQIILPVLVGSRLGTQGSVRVRLGYAFDRTLLYVTGGLAGASLKQSVRNGAAVATNSGTEYGYTVGAGVEYAFTNNLSARIEYRYTDYGSTRGRGTLLGQAINSSIKTTDSAIRVGLTYRFGGPAGPILARY